MKNYFKLIISNKKSPADAVAIPSPRVPEGQRIYCIGDIHGRDDLLQTLTNKIIEDAASFEGQKIVVFLGDYIDRGMRSKQVIDILLDESFFPEFEKVFLCGNHEQTLLDFLKHDAAILRDWWCYGAQTTFYSYGVVVAGIPPESRYLSLQEQLKAAVPSNHTEFFEHLSSHYQAGDYYFVHAGIKPGVALDMQREKDLYWIRDEFLKITKPHEKIIVHGHTIVDEPEFLTNRIAIDTGAYLSGKLTCLILEDETQRTLFS